MSLKGNHGELRDDVRFWFESQKKKTVFHTDIDAGHGRIETR